MPGRGQDNSNAFYEFERAGWERVAGDYHRYFAALTTRFIDPLLDAGGVRAGSRVLDVATGPGYVAAAAARRGAEVEGIDFAEAAVAVARQQHPAITFQTGSAEKLPFPDALFDAVVMNFGLLHVAQPELALAEAYRVLRSRWPGCLYGMGRSQHMSGIQNHTQCNCRTWCDGRSPAGRTALLQI